MTNDTPRIVLHVGYGKTGTSYIQSALALSLSNLSECGVIYPEHRNFAAARAGGITGGNLVGYHDWNEKIRMFTESAKGRVVLFSAESLFNNILKEPLHLSALANTFSISVVLFVRDPIDHFLSAYGQKIKRGGYTGGVCEYAARYDYPKKAARLIKTCLDADVTLEVRNYSRCEDKLLDTFANLISPDEKLCLVRPKKIIVNRSLTRSEMELQRLFNLHFGAGSDKFVSDVLCNEVPYSVGDRFQLSREDVELISSKIRSQVNILNTLLPDSETLKFPDLTMYPSADEIHGESDFVFSADQMAALVQAISREITKMRTLSVDVPTLTTLDATLASQP